MEGKKNNGYFKWVTLGATVLFMIISASFSYTLLTNKRVDKLDVKLDEIASDVSYIRGLLDGRDSQSRDIDDTEDCLSSNGDVLRGNPSSFIRTCYRILFDKGAEEEVYLIDKRIE